MNLKFGDKVRVYQKNHTVPSMGNTRVHDDYFDAVVLNVTTHNVNLKVFDEEIAIFTMAHPKQCELLNKGEKSE